MTGKLLGRLQIDSSGTKVCGERMADDGARTRAPQPLVMGQKGFFHRFERYH